MSTISAPKGFILSVASAGFKKSGKPDLSLIYSETPAVAAGVFTTNLFKAAPVLVGEETIHGKKNVKAVITNTGQANACTGEEGLADCRLSLELLSKELGIAPTEILPASTGVIGARMRMDLWETAIPQIKENMGKTSVEELAAAMMTTDSFPKFASQSIEVSGKTITLTGVAKGAGMICPNMATMISIVMCDADIEQTTWQAMFERAIQTTFNRATVDGDTSTNDTLYGLANGASGVKITDAEVPLLEKSLEEVLAKLAYMLVQDGEGATKVIHIHVKGAKSLLDAEKAARTVGHSPLVKTAMYGKDPNWGRIVAALGRSGADFNPMDVVVTLCGVELFRKGRPTTEDFDSLLKAPMEKQDLTLEISLGNGSGEYTLLASDLTHEYVSINADYRS